MGLRCEYDLGTVIFIFFREGLPTTYLRETPLIPSLQSTSYLFFLYFKVHLGTFLFVFNLFHFQYCNSSNVTEVKQGYNLVNSPGLLSQLAHGKFRVYPSIKVFHVVAAEKLS